MSVGDVIGLCTTGIAGGATADVPRARDLVKPDEVRELLRSAKDSRNAAERVWDENFPPGIMSGAAIELSGAADRITKAGLLDDVVTAARRLKQAESDYREAQHAYGEAVKRLSDEAVK